MTSISVPTDKDDTADFTGGVLRMPQEGSVGQEALEKKLSEPELKCVGELREELVDEPITARACLALIRFSRARQLDVDKAEEMVRNMLKWRHVKIFPQVVFQRRLKISPNLFRKSLQKG